MRSGIRLGKGRNLSVPDGKYYTYSFCILNAIMRKKIKGGSQYMKRRWTGCIAAVVMLVSLCLPVLSAGAAARESGRKKELNAGGIQADYTVEHIGREGENETLLARETFRARAGKTVNVEYRQFENFVKEERQDLTLTVTADGGAVKKIYYTGISYDRIVFRTQGTYIAPIYGREGENISSRVEKLEEPVRQGYIFKGWDKEIPSVMPEGEYVVNALWEPGESRYTVLCWMENAEDDGYTLLGKTEVRTAQTGSTVTASQEDIDRAGFMADWFPNLDYYKDYYGFDYARCEDTVVTPDGKAVLNLYYDREMWTVNLHEEAEHESGTSDSLKPNDDIWYTATGKYGSALPEDFPTLEELEEYYMGKTQFQDVKFLGVRDEFESVSRHLDTFYFQDLATGNHTFDAYPWMEHDAYPIYVTYFMEGKDGKFYRARMESAQVDRDPSVYGAEITILHPTALTCDGGWYTTGNTPEECEQGERIPIRQDQARSDGKCVFRGVKTHLFVYMKRDTFTLNYMDIDSTGGDKIYKTEQVTYRDDVDLDFVPVSEEHGDDRFSGWYLSPALTDSGDPITAMTMPPEDINVYAGWNAAQWSVSFDVQGGTEAPAVQTVTDGQRAAMPESPQREGYLFTGWFSEEDEKDVRKSWDFERPVEKDMTLYAGWHPVVEAAFTVRHIIDGEQEPFHEETGKGGSGDTVYIRPLEPTDQGYPSDLLLETGFERRKVTLKKGADSNVYTVTYRMAGMTGGEEGGSDDATDGTADGGSDGVTEGTSDEAPDGATDILSEENGDPGRHEMTSPSGEGSEGMEEEKAAVPATGDPRNMIWLFLPAVMAAVPGIGIRAADVRK